MTMPRQRHTQKPLSVKFSACTGLLGIKAVLSLSGVSHKTLPLLTAESLRQPGADTVLGAQRIQDIPPVTFQVWGPQRECKHLVL